MNGNRIVSLILAALFLAFCCLGCAKNPTPADEESGIPVRMKNGGRLSFLPEEPLSIPTPPEMVYTRPDTEKLISDIEALTANVSGYGDAEALLDDYYEVELQLHDLWTMDSIAFYRYTMDTSDGYYSAEYDFCEEQNAVVEEKKSALYAAFAASPFRDALEQAYFGEGFFRGYDDFNSAGEEYFDLKQQENDLLFRYYELAGNADYTSYRDVQKNHEASGGILIELIRVRQKIAAAKGFDSYMDYSYACDFQRDYTPADAREYLEGVKALIAPLTSADGFELGDYSIWNESEAMAMLSSAAEKMGGPVWEAYRFMSGHQLYDIAYGPDKMSIGYTSYFADYEAPFIFVDPYTKDVLYTLFHEFGHFTDWYRNYGVAGDYETGETYSQAMEYLAFAYAEQFSDSAREQNLRAVLADLTVYSVLQTGAFADFELQAYALPPEELTVERLDGIFSQCLTDYGIEGFGDVRFKTEFWSVYQHFFSYPGYVISYSDSAVASLQICRMEAEKQGAGVDAFCRLLNRTHGKKFVAVLEEVGLDSPFEEATLEKTAAFLKDAFDID